MEKAYYNHMGPFPVLWGQKYDMLHDREKNKINKSAVTRIQTWVFVATTQSTYHYIITAVDMIIKLKPFMSNSL